MSDALWYHHREAQNHSPEHSHSPFLDGGIIFPPLSGMLDPCQSSSNNWKLISFGTTWLHPKLVLKKLSLYLSLLPLLACTYLNNDRDLVLRALPLSDCLFKMNRFVFPNCKSLWIKASAKCNQGTGACILHEIYRPALQFIKQEVNIKWLTVYCLTTTLLPYFALFHQRKSFQTKSQPGRCASPFKHSGVSFMNERFVFKRI